MSNYLTIKENSNHEIEIKKSRFIASFKRVENEAEAQEFIKEIKKIHRDATHNCSAYTIGENDQIQRANDDGEPSGTAGIPMLEALKLMKLKNIVVVVTRYFGGIKLGSGGLIRAYSNAVSKGALAIGVVRRVLQPEISFTIGYDKLGSIDYYLEQNNIFVSDKEFGAEITIKVFLNEADIEKFEADLNELLQGQIKFTHGEPRYNELPIEQTNLKDLTEIED